MCKVSINVGIQTLGRNHGQTHTHTKTIICSPSPSKKRTSLAHPNSVTYNNTQNLLFDHRRQLVHTSNSTHLRLSLSPANKQISAISSAKPTAPLFAANSYARGLKQIVVSLHQRNDPVLFVLWESADWWESYYSSKHFVNRSGEPSLALPSQTRFNHYVRVLYYSSECWFIT